MMLKSALKHPMTPSRRSLAALRSVDGVRLWEKAKLLKQEVMIEKPGLSSTHSPSPTPVEEASDDDFAMNMVQWNAEFQRKKVKVSLD